MPTVGWILETAEDRFYERGGDGTQREPPTFACPICSDTVRDLLQVSWHINQRHPLERPLLLMRGQPAPTEIVVRTPLGASDVSFANSTHLRATRDGRRLGELMPDELGQQITGAARAVFLLELENRRAADEAKIRAAYTVRIAIPTAIELEAVDRLFVQHLAVDTPTIRDVLAFKEEAAPYGSAERYVDGLTDYALGVLAKEGDARAGTTLPFDAFEPKFKRALAELADHDMRPVARTVCAAARLNINDVRTPLPPTGDAALDGCLLALCALGVADPSITISAPTNLGVRVPLCPVDRDTYLVVRAFIDLFGEQAPPADRVADYSARAEDATLSQFDRTKLLVMLAARMISEGHRQAASDYLQRLAHEPVFGRWAQLELDALSTP